MRMQWLGILVLWACTASAGTALEAIDAHRPLLDPALDPRARVLRQHLRQRLVQPPAGEIKGKLEAMGLELGGQLAGPMGSGQMGTGGRYTLARPATISN